MQNLNNKSYRNVHILEERNIFKKLEILFCQPACVASLIFPLLPSHGNGLALTCWGAALSAYRLSGAPGVRTPVAPFQTAQQPLCWQAKLEPISQYGDWGCFLKLPLTEAVNRFTTWPRRLVCLWLTRRKGAFAGQSKRGQEIFQAPLLVSLSIISHEDLTETLDDPIFSLGGGLGGRRAGAWSGGSGGAGGPEREMFTVKEG